MRKLLLVLLTMLVAVGIIGCGNQAGRKLAVLKDSYAHAFIPFLIPHYDEIHVIDLRYNRNSVSEYLREHQINEALFLYNIPNFVRDLNLQTLQ